MKAGRRACARAPHDPSGRRASCPEKRQGTDAGRCRRCTSPRPSGLHRSDLRTAAQYCRLSVVVVRRVLRVLHLTATRRADICRPDAQGYVRCSRSLVHETTSTADSKSVQTCVLAPVIIGTGRSAFVRISFFPCCVSTDHSLRGWTTGMHGFPCPPQKHLHARATAQSDCDSCHRCCWSTQLALW